MSSSDFTPPGPSIEPFQGYAGSSAAPSPTDPGAAWQGHSYAPVLRPGGLATSSLLLAGGVTLINSLMAVVAVFLAASDGSDSLLFGVVGYGFLAIILALLMLAAYIVTCLWLVQCRKFADAYRPGDQHRRGNTWVWLGWWVPIASLFVPCQVVRDRYRASRPWPADSGLVSFWWFLWLVYNILSLFGGETADGLPSPTSEVISAVLGAAAFACWAVIIRRIDAGQNEQELAGLPR